ncbi:hypothetical protein WEN_01220 [Mycoplasma wenyonii str. Massachusetts]|uniref:Uncharacterized protein n=1 Tax=Mycoplasma wenyonii (strain Massachusetts) TaxID=1197325 RepID=I6Z639_MYCWM|nr:hypothetical protein [Mycoplasma wenyonii]AFN65043.1 hypothetical protein WEN_01220 [Mycoplasma wenyonii str. Massachusetts]
MIWKKLFLELTALGGFSGGIGSWFSHSGGGIQEGTSDESIFFGANTGIKKKEPRSKEVKQKTKSLDKTSLRSWRWKSEGVGEEFLFVEGWDKAGAHKLISSETHSQAIRDLYGGLEISPSMGWFGPRKVTQELEEIEQVKETHKNLSYWPRIKDSGGYIDQRDLDGLQEFWERRGKELEEDIFGLYHGWDWWADKFGKKKDRELVDLEFDLSKIKDMLGKTEDQLRDQKWSYGKIFQNPKLAVVRLIGDVEGTAFNYLKKVAWPEASSVKQLKEKNIAKVALGLIAGTEYGFDCSSSETDIKSKFFKECDDGSRLEGAKVKRVMKAAVTHIGRYVSKAKTEQITQKWRWHEQISANAGEWKKMNTMDSVESSALIEEKCELQAAWYEYLTDSGREIRREVCDLIIRPWFGDVVPDKRLCLMEITDHKYYLRLQTYLKVVDIPAWMNKNTFWTKCSNYGI